MRTRRDETRRSSDQIGRAVAASLVIVAVASCVPAGDEAVIAASRPEARRPIVPPAQPKPAPWYDPAATRHDFGLVLAGADVTRSHTFRIINNSTRSVPIRGVANRKPCCGEVGPVAATSLEPGRALEVPVTLKLGLGSGTVVHVAAIGVGGAEEEINLFTTATAHARGTVDAADPATILLEPGQARRVEYLIRSFGVAGDPPTPLDDRAIRCELPTEWVGPATTKTEPQSGITELRRSLAVMIPATGDPGRRLAKLEICTAAGAVIGQRQVQWELAAALTASPAGLILGADAVPGEPLKVVIRSRDGRPFRITAASTAVAGLSVAADADAKSPHVVRCRFEAAGASGSKTGEVVIRTDHPAQPMVKVAVYVAGLSPDPTPSVPPGSTP